MQFLMARVFRGVKCGVLLLSLAGCGESRLIHAIRQGDVAVAEQLIAQGSNLNAKGAGADPSALSFGMKHIF